jgi:uncharacterized protein involved in high-affinity Fe2+ transport
MKRHLVLFGALVCVSVLTACGSSRGLGSGSTGGSMSAMRSVSQTSTGMSSGEMNMHVSAHTLKVDGITPIPTETLSSSDWQHMKIVARAMTAVPFVIFNGTHEQTVKIPRHVSFHLMVTLNDARSGVPIPYASVWATITHNGKVVYDERQWPMLSEYLGPHYGNNVALPGGGHYRLSLLISPPVAARHLEYKNVWLRPHRVTASFDWRPPKS